MRAKQLLTINLHLLHNSYVTSSSCAGFSAATSGSGTLSVTTESDFSATTGSGCTYSGIVSTTGFVAGSSMIEEMLPCVFCVENAPISRATSATNIRWKKE